MVEYVFRKELFYKDFDENLSKDGDYSILRKSCEGWTTNANGRVAVFPDGLDKAGIVKYQTAEYKVKVEWCERMPLKPYVFSKKKFYENMDHLGFSPSREFWTDKIDGDTVYLNENGEGTHKGYMIDKDWCIPAE